MVPAWPQAARYVFCPHFWTTILIEKTHGRSFTHRQCILFKPTRFDILSVIFSSSRVCFDSVQNNDNTHTNTNTTTINNNNNNNNNNSDDDNYNKTGKFIKTVVKRPLST